MSQLLNHSFESDLTNWTTIPDGGSFSIRSDKATDGVKAAWFTGAVGGADGVLKNDNVVDVYEGLTISGGCNISLDTPDDSNSSGNSLIYWLDDSLVQVGVTQGNLVAGDTRGAWHWSAISGTAPAGATKAQFAIRCGANEHGGVLVDNASWNYTADRTIVIASPDNNSEFSVEDTIPLAVTIGGSAPPIVSVEYIFDDGTNPPTTEATSAVSPYSANVTGLDPASYSVTAKLNLQGGGSVTSAAITVVVAAVPTPPITREYKASNSYARLIAENFVGLSANMPATARVVGAEVIVDYSLRILARVKDTDTDAAGSNQNTAFDITDGGTVEVSLLTKEDQEYSLSGNPILATIPIDRTDYTVVEEGLSDEKKWIVMDSIADSVTIGAEDSLFGLDAIAASDFIERALSVRFYPNVVDKPAYADSGDACFRFFINKLRLRIYFDAGSALYYFASPDKSEVISGELVAAYVETGNFETGDASGVLQLKPSLEVIDGTTTWIGDDWTIHAAYPPTDDNQIGLVDVREANDGIGMSYNGLPSAGAIVDNRSRYMFITANFYGDDALDSIYGANGVGRGFSYNGDFFYTIQTTPEVEKDKPRHVAYHHGHLAFGFDEGRVDVSVVGSPYNFSGADGASSWSMGDKVHGLLSLSGTLLGVFCSNMVWALSGTTVDNFATQIISPKMGAIEYTVTDMGFPVYANAYGIYTLAQTQQYGDYLGTPMSQPVSPWLRPRLIRKSTSNKEVVVAWPVRSKNQYRIAFADGAILSMTINSGMQTAPTFSFQNYILYTEADE